MARIICLTIDNEWIKGAGVFAGATGSHDDVILRMTFSEHWDGYGLMAEFLDANHENAKVVTIGPADLVEDTLRTYDVLIPAAAKAVPGNMVVTIKGAKTSGSTETNATLSVYGEFEIKESLWTPAADEQEAIDAAVAEQLEAEIAAISSAITGMTVSATSLDPILPATVTKTYTEGHYNLEFGIPRGIPGISVQAGNRYGFYVDENGHLHVVYEDDVEEPEFHIDENGHLIMTLN